jgi:hypothetical protein
MKAATQADRLASPFEPALKAHCSELPPALREQYLLPVEAPYRLRLEGTMDCIWHRPAWLWPMFLLLAQFDILFPETGAHIPARMDVIGGRDAQGRPYQHWNRSYRFPAVTRRFNAIMAYDEKQRCVVEWLGPAHVGQILWSVTFVRPNAIEIVSAACQLRLGSLRLPLSRLLYPSVRAVETALDEDTIHIDLRTSHPWLGDIFGYEGTFHLLRISKNDSKRPSGG